MGTFRDILKSLAYGSGFAGLYHRVRNSRKLTIAMFHRVLPENHPQWAVADPQWTISSRLFADCLEFFVEHYNVISFERLLAARQDASRLPDQPLLITFDDGWADNADYALHGLRKQGLPALVFVVAGAVNRGAPWDERLRYANRRGSIRMAQWQELTAALDFSGSSIEVLIARLAPMEAAHREQLVDALVASPAETSAGDLPVMLSLRQIRELIDGGVTIGSHGMTHTPILQAHAPETEIAGSRRALSEMLKDEQRQQRVLSISFPHGMYDEACIRHAQQAGYEFLFTSDPYLTSLEPGDPLPQVLGRIHISGRNISKPDGSLDRAKLAFWLFQRASASAQKALVWAASQQGKTL